MCEFYQALLWILFVQGPKLLMISNLLVNRQNGQHTARGPLK